MEDRRKLLLAVIVFTALSNIYTEQLDMAPDAVDDLYDTCKEEAMRVIKSGLLGQELDRNEDFKKIWNGNTQCSQQTPGRLKEQAVAVSTYVNANQEFKGVFNSAVKTMDANVTTYEKNFHFKSLHFLLMTSMMKQLHNCKTVFFFQDKEYNEKVGSKVRFGIFKEAVENFTTLKKFEDLEGSVVFNVTSCFYVNLKDNNCTKKADNNILLSPDEVFTVESVNSNEDDSYTEVILNHSEVKSFQTCYISWSPARVPNMFLVLVLVALSLFFLNY